MAPQIARRRRDALSDGDGIQDGPEGINLDLP